MLTVLSARVDRAQPQQKEMAAASDSQAERNERVALCVCLAIASDHGRKQRHWQLSVSESLLSSAPFLLKTQ